MSRDFRIQKRRTAGKNNHHRKNNRKNNRKNSQKSNQKSNQKHPSINMEIRFVETEGISVYPRHIGSLYVKHPELFEPQTDVWGVGGKRSHKIIADFKLKTDKELALDQKIEEYLDINPNIKDYFMEDIETTMQKNAKKFAKYLEKEVERAKTEYAGANDMNNLQKMRYFESKTGYSADNLKNHIDSEFNYAEFRKDNFLYHITLRNYLGTDPFRSELKMRFSRESSDITERATIINSLNLARTTLTKEVLDMIHKKIADLFYYQIQEDLKVKDPLRVKIIPLVHGQIDREYYKNARNPELKDSRYYHFTIIKISCVVKKLEIEASTIKDASKVRPIKSSFTKWKVDASDIYYYGKFKGNDITWIHKTNEKGLYLGNKKLYDVAKYKKVYKHYVYNLDDYYESYNYAYKMLIDNNIVPKHLFESYCEKNKKDLVHLEISRDVKTKYNTTVSLKIKSVKFNGEPINHHRFKPDQTIKMINTDRADFNPKFRSYRWKTDKKQLLIYSLDDESEKSGVLSVRNEYETDKDGILQIDGYNMECYYVTEV